MLTPPVDELAPINAAGRQIHHDSLLLMKAGLYRTVGFADYQLQLVKRLL